MSEPTIIPPTRLNRKMGQPSLKTSAHSSLVSLFIARLPSGRRARPHPFGGSLRFEEPPSRYSVFMPPESGLPPSPRAARTGLLPAAGKFVERLAEDVTDLASTVQ